MNSGLVFDLRIATIDIFIIAIAIGAAEVVHYLLFASVRWLLQRRPQPEAARTLIRHISNPIRLLFISLALTIAFQRLEFTGIVAEMLRRALVVCYIVTFTWWMVSAIEILYALAMRQVPVNFEDNLQSRRKRTHLDLLRQIAIWVVLFVGFAATLMSFPAVRNVGAGLFASAGVAGLVLGIAARPTLGNLIAGLQIALTEPIRVGDSVVVEGEFGQVVEVNTTYVVIRLWDLRHMIVPVSHFIEKTFQNWTRYSSDLIGAVHLQMDYTVPVEKLREYYKTLLESCPLWDGKTQMVQVTDSSGGTIEIRFLMSAANATAAYNLRCHVREKLLDHLQREYPESLPKNRSEVAMKPRVTA
jgi:small-conductance mechanosensitive channel